jgi:hypothetical protein
MQRDFKEALNNSEIALKNSRGLSLAYRDSILKLICTSNINLFESQSFSLNAIKLFELQKENKGLLDDSLLH